ncbi:MAG TPA: hypothetical protein VK066_26455 [Chloroflexota bacterium]|nr:hypothetical protein [Chloroflexota bacterium]
MNRWLVVLGAPILLAAGLALAPSSAARLAPSPTLVSQRPLSPFAIHPRQPVGLPEQVSDQDTSSLTAVHFVDARHGWVAGLGWILATADGGQTWAPQISTTDPIASFAFVDPSTGWAVGRHSFVGTTDGGQTWQRRDETTPDLAAVSFATRAVGWGLAGMAPPRGQPAAAPQPAPGAIAATSDGGETWAPTAAQPAPMQSVCLADSDQGWAASHAGVWRTGDGGVTWTSVLVAPAESSGDAQPLREGFTADVQCVDGDTAWVLFTAPGAMMQTGWALYRSGDAGATWTPVAQSGQFFPATDAARGTGGWNRVRLAAVDAGTAYVVGTCVPCSPPGAAGSGTVSLGVSRDAGQSWQDLPPLPDTFGAAIVSAPFAASFPTAEHGWLVAPGSTNLYATADGGTTWTSHPLDVSP